METLLKEKNIDIGFYTYNKQTKIFENKFNTSSVILHSLIEITNFLSVMNIEFEILEDYSIKIIEYNSI